ncbi:MAG: DNA primase [Halobacteriota archaeon]
MNPLDARYPFFASAREAVEAAGVSLPTLIAEDAPAVSRGRERVERALMAGDVEPEDPREWTIEEELLSYPIARILVSLVDAPAAVEKYAAAEAATARERLLEDFERADDGLRSVDTPRASFDEVLGEFDLDGVVAEDGGERFWVDVGTYLELADPEWGDRWRLVNRDLAAGRVVVEREELHRLLQAAVEARVADGLPFDVTASPAGETIAEALADEVEQLRDLLAARDPIRDIDTVVPELFPPCMTHLLERVRREATLEPHAGFALTAFLTGIGMDTDEIIDLYRNAAIDEDLVRYQTEYLRDGVGTQYAPPSCATMEAYGDCFPDEQCKSISHPMAYYGTVLAAVDDAEVRDWRERDEAMTDGGVDDEVTTAGGRPNGD